MLLVIILELSGTNFLRIGSIEAKNTTGYNLYLMISTVVLIRVGYFLTKCFRDV